MSGSMSKQIVLGAYLSYGTGHHAASWRHPNSIAGAGQSIEHYIRMANIAEEGLFDFLFLADTPSVFNDDREGFGSRVVVFEPMTLLSAIAMRTKDLGLIATSSTTYKDPYNTAREFASLDLISGGRAGWNLVTSSKQDAAHNFGLNAHPQHEDRYRRAREFFDVVTGLWDSWDDDAFPRDKASGVFYDPTKRHELNHSGESFSVRGPLNIGRPPQGYPVIVQAGSSATGQDLAAQTAEIVFTAQSELGAARKFYAELKSRLPAYNRLNADIIVMPGLCPIVARTDQEAQEKLRYLQSLVSPELGVSLLSDLVGGFDLRSFDIDGPLPPLPPSNQNQSRRAMIEDLSRGGTRSIRQIYEQLTIARGHLVLVGSYSAVAKKIAQWFIERGADGFNVMPAQLPDDLREFVQSVVPELQEMNIFKSSYRHGTLRDKLSIKRPDSRYSYKT